MRFVSSCVCIFSLIALAARGAEPEALLPSPEFHAEASDPAWLAPAVQLHGHLGPWLVAGLRMGAAGRKAVEAHGYFDVEVTVEGPLSLPPQSCFLDGIQTATGATLGKRNLKWNDAPKLAVYVKNVKSGKAAIVRPSDAMMEWIAEAKGEPLSPANKEHGAGHADQHAANDPHDADAVARKIAKSPDGLVLSVSDK
jgi:formylmethanofuran dehydrogenase subunit E